MKSPNKLVGALLMSALTVGSVFPADGILDRMSGYIPSFDQARAVSDSFVKSVGGLKIAERVARVGRKVKSNPKKAGAMAIAVAGVGLVAHKYLQVREEQASFFVKNLDFEFCQPRTDALYLAMKRLTVDPVRAGFNSVIRAMYSILDGCN